MGKKSLAGTRAAVRTVIRYRNGLLNGKGASLLDDYMEDLATDRVHRLMIAHRVRHGEAAQILDDRGNQFDTRQNSLPNYSTKSWTASSASGPR